MKVAQLNVYLADFNTAAAHVRPGSTLMPVIGPVTSDGAADRSLSLKVKPFLHASGYVAAARGAVDLSNYEAHVGYFPVRLRRRDAAPHAAEPVTLAEVSESPDYVLLWGDAHGLGPAYAVLPQMLAARYRLIHTSPLGHMRVYELVD
jgi:hypothetical protein